MKKEIKLLIFLWIIAFILNYNIVDSYLKKTFIDYETGMVERIIDGDTIVVNGEKIRLLGINSPEKGEVGADLAQIFLENKILGKEVKIYFDGAKKDRYNRTLGYIFLGCENVNLESVELGYSNYYFPMGASKYSKEIKNAWEVCLANNVGLCEKSKNKCIKLKSLDIKSQKIIFENICSFEVKLDGWSVKDEGRKKLILSEEKIEKFGEIILTTDMWKEKYVWTKTGDSVFVRDEENKLVLFYGY